ncbi:hypothetical protein EON80_08025 [bacterium]|nr:MAG: hypothetical protein EON80_08025 [bacterium]
MNFPLRVAAFCLLSTLVPTIAQAQGVRRDIVMGRYLYRQPTGTKPNAQLVIKPNVMASAIENPNDMKEVNQKMLQIEGTLGNYPFGFQIIYQDSPANVKELFPHGQKSIYVTHSVSSKPKPLGLTGGDIMFPGFEPKNFFNSPWENIVNWITRTSTVREIKLAPGLNYIFITADPLNKIMELYRPPKAKGQAQEFALEKLESNNESVFAVWLSVPSSKLPPAVRKK